MTEWKHGFEIFPPVIEPPSLNEVIKNITDLRKNNEINKQKYNFARKKEIILNYI